MKQMLRSKMLFDQLVQLTIGNVKKNFLFDKRSRSVQLFLIKLYYILFYAWNCIELYIILLQKLYIILCTVINFVSNTHMYETLCAGHDSGSHSCSIWKRAEFYWIVPYCYGMRRPIFKFLKIKKKLNILFKKRNWFFYVNIKIQRIKNQITIRHNNDNPVSYTYTK